MSSVTPVGRPAPGEIGEESIGTVAQAHHLQFALCRNKQAPPTRPRPEAPLEALIAAFELRGRQDPGAPARNHQAHIPCRRRAARIVHGIDPHLRIVCARVEQVQPALLAFVAGGVENRDVVTHQPAGFTRYGVVHGSHIALPAHRAQVGAHLDFEIACQLQPPVAFTGTGAPVQTLVRIAEFQVLRVEMPRLTRLNGQGQRIVGPNSTVEGLDAHLPGHIGAIDNACEALAAQRIPMRRK